MPGRASGRAVCALRPRGTSLYCAPQGRPRMLLLAEAKARALCLEALTGKGIPPDDAGVCADAIMFATLRGLDSHGIVSILPGICHGIALGRIDPSAEVLVIGPNVLKGNGAAGPVIGARTMRRAIDAARQNGVGAAVGFNRHPFGAAADSAVLPAQAGMI